MRGVKLGAGTGFARAIVVKPLLARLEAHDDRVLGGVIMFGRVLTWGRVTTADVAALRAPAKMQPPSAGSQALDAARSARLGRGVDAIPLGLHGFNSLRAYTLTTDAFMSAAQPYLTPGLLCPTSMM